MAKKVKIKDEESFFISDVFQALKKKKKKDPSQYDGFGKIKKRKGE